MKFDSASLIWPPRVNTAKVSWHAGDLVNTGFHCIFKGHSQAALMRIRYMYYFIVNLHITEKKKKLFLPDMIKIAS